MIFPSKISTTRIVCSRVPKRTEKLLRPRPSVVSDVNTISYFVGKSIILFTMFYCGMNWYHYRSIRKDVEKDDK